MLSDYKRYLLKIRNSLIRCGVELEVKDAQDYEEIFYLGEMLSDLLWFYSVLEISGSEDKLRGFMFPLNSHYKNSLRDKYFEDYLIYRAGYMEISASDAILRDKLQENKDKKEVTPMSSTLEFIKTVQSTNSGDEEVDFGNWGSSDEIDYLEDDDFVNYGNNEEEEFKNNESGYTTNSTDTEDDEFIDYGDSEVDDDFVDYSNSSDVEDDEFINYSDNEKDDEFINYSSEKDFGSWGNYEDDGEEEEEVFGSWGSLENEEVNPIDEISSIESEEEDVFASWGNSAEEDEDEFVSTSDEGDEDEFASWGSSDEDDLENDFGSWGSADSTQEVDDFGNSDEDDFGNWGSSDNSEEEEDEDVFSSWGGDSEEENEEAFGSWGNSNDDVSDSYEEAEEEYDEDVFGSWGNSEDNEDIEENTSFEEDEEEAFGSWGSSEESGSDFDDSDGSDFGSWGDSLDTSKSPVSSSVNDKSPSSKKSKLDYEIESNEKTAKIIEKIALGIFGKGNTIKSKISEKIKNMDENQD